LITNDYQLYVVPAQEKSQFGRNMGGLLIGINNSINKFVNTLSQCKNFITFKIDKKCGLRDTITLVFAYCPPQKASEPIFESLLEKLSENNNVSSIAMGDFNCRIGNSLSNNKDLTVNPRGNLFIENFGRVLDNWNIVNGNWG